MNQLKGYKNMELSNYLEYFESMNLVVDNSKKNSILKKVEQARKKEEQLENSKRHSQYLETRYQNCFVQQGRDKQNSVSIKKEGKFYGKITKLSGSKKRNF